MPIGSDDFIKFWLNKHLDDYRSEADQLRAVDNPQHKWLFLYYCFARKPAYVLRHIMPKNCDEFCEQFDLLLRSVFESILKREISQDQWHQVTIPIREGGFGLPKTKDVSRAAFAANALETKAFILRSMPPIARTILNPHDGDELPRFTRAAIDILANVKQVFLDNEQENEDVEAYWNDRYDHHASKLTLQYFFTNVFSKNAIEGVRDGLADNPNKTSLARFISVAKKHTGDFLLACPKTKGLTFKPLDFITSMKLRLGCDLSNMPHRCSCTRRPLLEDKRGTHLLHCPKGGNLIKKHNAIQHDVMALATSAGVQASCCNKDVAILNEAGDTRRGDLLLPQCGKDERNLILDFSITHPACPTYCTATVNNPNSAIQRVNDTKNNKYKERAEANDIEFMPMALECYGALSPEFVKVLKFLCEKRANLTNSNKTTILQYWYKRISCTLQKRNCRSIANRILDITQNNAHLNDECFDHLIDHEHDNIDSAFTIKV